MSIRNRSRMTRINGTLSTLSVLVILIIPTLSLAAPPSSERPIEVLMIVGGNSHDYTALPQQLADTLNRNKDINVRVTADLGILTGKTAGEIDVLMFNCCRDDELTARQRKVITNIVRQGKGLIAMHCAFWSFQTWPEWRQIIGGIVQKHDPLGPFDAVVIDRNHPITRGLPEQFTITDEPYLAEERTDNQHVLVRTARPHGHHTEPEAMVWTQRYAGGRVFSIMFGHDAQSQTNPVFLTLLTNGIRWAGRQLAPATMLSQEESDEGFVPLFDGKTLEGWHYNPKYWKVENGFIIGNSGAKGLKEGTYAICPKVFGDFVLRYTVGLLGGNSGMQFRSKEYPGFTVAGYQADIARLAFGSLHEQFGRRRLVDGWTGKGENAVNLRDFNDMEVIAKGPHIIIKVNGVVTVDYTETTPSIPQEGIIALQLHDHELMEVWFTNIRIKPIKTAKE